MYVLNYVFFLPDDDL